MDTGGGGVGGDGHDTEWGERATKTSRKVIFWEKQHPQSTPAYSSSNHIPVLFDERATKISPLRILAE